MDERSRKQGAAKRPLTTSYKSGRTYAHILKYIKNKKIKKFSKTP